MSEFHLTFLFTVLVDKYFRPWLSVFVSEICIISTLNCFSLL